MAHDLGLSKTQRSWLIDALTHVMHVPDYEQGHSVEKCRTLSGGGETHFHQTSHEVVDGLTHNCQDLMYRRRNNVIAQVFHAFPNRHTFIKVP